MDKSRPAHADNMTSTDERRWKKGVRDELQRSIHCSNARVEVTGMQSFGRVQLASPSAKHVGVFQPFINHASWVGAFES